MSDARLIEAALQARLNAHAPYSNFKVGAAIESESGDFYTGCNVENATYGLTMCAERVALYKALSEGARKFRRIVVAAATDKLTPPCGSCRQLLWEFCGDAELILVNTDGHSERMTMRDVFPRPFDDSFLS